MPAYIATMKTMLPQINGYRYPTACKQHEKRARKFIGNVTVIYFTVLIHDTIIVAFKEIQKFVVDAGLNVRHAVVRIVHSPSKAFEFVKGFYLTIEESSLRNCTDLNIFW